MKRESKLPLLDHLLAYCDLLFDSFEWLGILHFQAISNIYREAAKLRMRNLTALLPAAQVETARVSLGG